MRIFKVFISLLSLLSGIHISANAQFVNRGKIITITEGSVLTIEGDASNSGAIRNAGTIILSGNWTNINNYLSQNGKFVLNGATVQTIENKGQTFYTLELSGGGRKIFPSGVEVVNELILISGIAEVSNSRTFLLRANATITGGADDSYIEGALQQSGGGDLFFPVGKNGNYAPMELLNITGVSPVTKIEAFEPNPPSVAGFGVDEISAARYWQRTLISGTFEDAVVKLSLKDESIISDLNKAIVAESNTLGGEYTSLSQQEITGDATDGTITSFDKAKGFFYAIATELNEGRKSDSLALVALYESNGGATWVNNSGWLQNGQLLESWNGIVINGSTGRVVQVNLPENNLTGELTSKIRLLEELQVLDLSGNALSGAVPGQLRALTSLTSLDLSDNDLTTLPDLTTLTGTNINVTGNQLNFNNLEPYRTFANITYNPQDSLKGAGELLLFDRGQNFLVSVSANSINNTYQWLLNNEPIAGATGREYEILDLSRVNMGDYRCEVKNTVITDLTLFSENSKILATADISGSLIVSDTEFLTSGDIKLLKITESAYDTISVKPLLSTGVYEFKKVVLADYVIVTDPFDKESFLPTYHESTIQWDQADKIILNNDTTGVDILVERKPRDFTPEEGNGLFGGEIFTDFPDDETGRLEARRRVRRVGVALRRRRGQGRTEDEDFELVGYTQTDDDGNFSFENLPPGLYRIFIEFPGIPIDPNSFTEFELGIDQDENSIAVAATVFEDGIVIEKKIETGIPFDYLDDLQIYPNPAEGGNINIKISARRKYEIKVELLDLRGMVVKSINISSLTLGNGVEQIDVSTLSSGIYMIKVTVPSFKDQLYQIGKLLINN